MGWKRKLRFYLYSLCILCAFFLSQLIFNQVNNSTQSLQKIRIEAENYQSGGQGTGYYDSTKGNRGKAYRQDDVDIQSTKDISGGFNVGWIDQGEWLTYNLDIPLDGKYKLVARVASDIDSKHGLKVSFDGKEVTSFSFKGTGGWQSWRDVQGQEISLTAGTHKLRLDMLSSKFNLNYVDFIPVSSSEQPTPSKPVPPTPTMPTPLPEPEIPEPTPEPTIINSEPKSVKIGAGGFVTGITIHPTAKDLIYARTDVGGLFRWNQSQQDWVQLLSVDRVGQAIDLNVESIALSPQDPNIIYAATGSYTHEQNNAKGKIINGNLLKSTDQGQTWEILDLSLPTGGNGEWRWTGERLSVDPHNSDVVYFGTRLNGLWKSDNGGKSWQQISTSVVPQGESFGQVKNLPGVTFVEFDSTSKVVNGETQTIYAGVSGQGIYRSTDGGKNWKPLSGGPGNNLIPQQGESIGNGELVVTFHDSQEEGKNGGVWKFDGSNWKNVTPSNGKNYAGLTVNDSDPNTLYTVTYPMTPNDIYRSTDGGETWKSLNNEIDGLDWWPSWSFWNLSGDLAVNPHNPNQVWVTNGIGVWKTENSNSNKVEWSAEVNGIEETVTFDAISTPGGANLITAIADFNGFRHENVDAFPTRNHSNGEFFTTTSIDYSAGNPNFVVAVSGHQHQSWVRESGFSKDNGRTWQKFASIINDNHPWDLNFGNIAVSATDTKNIVWQGSNWVAPYYTKDGGANWTKITYFDEQFGGGAHTNLWNPQQALAADSVAGGNFYIYHHVGGQLVRTQDGGETWTVANQDNLLPGGEWLGANVKTAPGIAGDVWVSLNEKGLYHSSNAGETFTKIEGVEDANVFGFGKAAPGSDQPTLFVQGEIEGQMGVFGSIDFGESWSQVDDLPDQFLSNVSTLTGDMNTFGRVYVGTDGNGFLYGNLD